jgi:hypothetical protein
MAENVIAMSSTYIPFRYHGEYLVIIDSTKWVELHIIRSGV